MKGGEAACLEEGAGHGFGGEGRHQAGGGGGGGGWVEQGPSTAAGSQKQRTRGGSRVMGGK